MFLINILVTFVIFLTGVYGLNGFFRAIMEGDEEKVTDVMKPSCTKTLCGIPVVDVNKRNKRRKTPLEFSVERGKENIAIILIKNGAKVPRGGNGINLLYNAIVARMENVVKFTLESADIDVNKEIIYPRRTTLVHEAISSKNAAIVKMICDEGADLEKVDHNFFTPLQYAIYKEVGAEIIRILLKSGANVNRKNLLRETALHFAGRHPKNKDNRNIMDLLLSVEDVDIEAVAYFGYTPLLSAACTANVECMQALLAAGANVNSKDYNGKTVLHQSTSRDNEYIIPLVKSYGFDFESRDKYGDTPFLYAAKNGDIQAMRLLGKAGSNVNVINKQKAGVFHYIVESSNPADMVEISLFYGADVELLNLKETDLPPVNLKMLDGKYKGQMGRLARNKLLEAGFQLNNEQQTEFLKDYWPKCHKIVKNDHFQNFQELFRKISQRYLKKHVPFTDDGRLINLLNNYELKGAFALFKILKTIYAKREPATDLERQKFEIFDYAVMKIMYGTYLTTLPVELTSDILLYNIFYRWKLETTSFHLALAFDQLSINLDQVKKAMVEIILNC